MTGPLLNLAVTAQDEAAGATLTPSLEAVSDPSSGGEARRKASRDLLFDTCGECVVVSHDACELAVMSEMLSADLW